MKTTLTFNILFMQKVEIPLYGKTEQEALIIKNLFNSLIANLNPAELAKIEQALRKNPKLLKTALKWI